MPERRPLVVIDGDLQELPSGDTLPGGGGGGSAGTLAGAQGTLTSSAASGVILSWSESVAHPDVTISGTEITFAADVDLQIAVSAGIENDNRAELKITTEIDSGAGYVAQPGFTASNYSNRDSNQNEGDTVLIFVHSFSAGDKIRFTATAVKDGGTDSLLPDHTRFTCISAGGVGADGGPGPAGDLTGGFTNLIAPTTGYASFHNFFGAVEDHGAVNTFTVDPTDGSLHLAAPTGNVTITLDGSNLPARPHGGCIVQLTGSGDHSISFSFSGGTIYTPGGTALDNLVNGEVTELAIDFRSATVAFVRPAENLAVLS